MELITAYLKKGIEGIALEQFRRMLLDPNIKKTLANGFIVFNNNKLIKCISNYYKLPDEQKKIKKNFSNNCFYAQRHFNISNNIGNYSCIDCHLACIELLKNKELKRR